jgi:hypothetical protein
MAYIHISSTPLFIRFPFIIPYVRLFIILVTHQLNSYITSIYHAFPIFVTTTVLYLWATQDVATNFRRDCLRRCGGHHNKRSDRSGGRQFRIHSIIKRCCVIWSVSRYGQITTNTTTYTVLDCGVPSIQVVRPPEH